MKLLYLSCHAILEYDELKLFEELGIEYFSLGSYLDPRNPVDAIRPALNSIRNEKWYNQAPDRNSIPKEFFDDFDVIIVMHVPEWIENNWENMKHKRVIWRTIGQSVSDIERRMKKYVNEGLQIVRYSPREFAIPDNAGCTQLIRFYKDENDFGGWNGLNNEVVTFCQNMKNRGEFCAYEPYLKVTAGLNAKVYGTTNDNLGSDINGGFLTYAGLKQKMRDASVYFYVGTQPASYTLNLLEAMMTGVPIVAVGDAIGNSMHIAGDTYEVPDIIQNGVNGYCSDSIEELREKIQFLLKNRELAKHIGQCGRETAIKLFGKQVVKQAWKDFLGV